MLYLRKYLLLIKMNKILTIILAGFLAVSCHDYDVLRFDPSDYTEEMIVIKNDTIRFRAYEHICYVENPEDTAFQTLNIYVPEIVEVEAPIFLRTYVGGYMAAKARRPSRRDATARALKEGYVVCIPGARGIDSKVVTAEGTVFTGRAPAGILDLKAAVRYLRHNDRLIPGNAERIITDGTSAGGAMSSLLGSSGNSPLFEPYLKAMGAADERDDVFASVCYCPIVDLEHADMAYEWLYSCTNDGIRGLTEEQKEVSVELSLMFPEYISGLGLYLSDGTSMDASVMRGYIKELIAGSAQRVIEKGLTIPEGIGIYVKDGNVSDVDLDAYLTYVAGTAKLKTPPAFDAKGVLSNPHTVENMLFGGADGSSANFTLYGCSVNGHTLDDKLQERVNLMNPMFHLDEKGDKAPYWYIRHGARDRDTGFSIPVALALKIENAGLDVDFALPWNRGHEGDYDLDDLFEWIESRL